ncbi:hypothetical protein [Pseudomonas sp. KCJK8993]|uniref:hypothetical protein n=1 Tax=Pseudomonas sp. KCJK8993 TaxID=3344565 RepID=UPI003905E39E
MGELEVGLTKAVSKKGFLDVLAELEQQHDVASLRYNGTQYWPLLRMMLGFENDPLVPPSQSKARFRDRLKKYGNALGSLFEDFIDPRHNLERDAPCDVYYLTHSTCRSLKIKGTYFDAFFSPLRHWCEEAQVPVDFYGEEFVPDSEYRTPRSEKTAYIQKHLTIVSLTNRFKDKPQLAEADLALIDVLRLELQSRGFGTQSVSLKAIENALTQLDLHKQRFSRVLKAKQPRLVMVATYYSVFGFALMAAANALGIRTIDLQHGVQGAGHFAYGTWGHVPRGGWDLLPRLFWNWTQEDVANIGTWGGEAHRGILGGRIFSQYLNEVDVEFAEYHDLTQRIRQSGCKQVVLVTLQPIDSEDFIDELRKAMQGPAFTSVFWLYRLHPAMMDKQGAYAGSLENERSDLALCSNLPLDYVIKLADLHVTLNSSVTIEAALEGIPSLLDHNCSYYMEWQERGIARRIEKGQSWSDAILQCLNSGSRFSRTQERPSASKIMLELSSE